MCVRVKVIVRVRARLRGEPAEGAIVRLRVRVRVKVGVRARLWGEPAEGAIVVCVAESP